MKFKTILLYNLFITLINNLRLILALSASCDQLFLTPYIESNKILEARKLSHVLDLPNSHSPQISSYSGYLTVNKQFNSNLFFWFFPSMRNSLTAPVLLWLEGGPGSSSMFSLFCENGPYVVYENLSIGINEYSWSNEFNLLYFDNPVGTGFSFTQDDDGFAKNEEDVANNLYEGLQQFFTLFSELRHNEFYVTGESYAGKYVPAIGYKLHTKSNESNINFKGIAIGNGWIDPITMLDYGELLYQIGLIDGNQLQYFQKMQNQTKKYINEGKFREAFLIMEDLIDGDLTDSTYFGNITGISNYYNFLFTNEPEEWNYYEPYLNLNETLNALHAGCVEFSDFNETVEINLIEDEFQSVKPWFVTLINNYKVLLYSGSLDIIVAAPLTDNFLKNLEWNHSKEFAKSDRVIWKVSESDREVAGYVKHVANFSHVIIRNAGHIAAFDQPRAVYDMITKFINSKDGNIK